MMSEDGSFRCGEQHKNKNALDDLNLRVDLDGFDVRFCVKFRLEDTYERHPGYQPAVLQVQRGNDGT